MHCYDFDVERFQRRKGADLIVLWISGGNHHPLSVSVLRDTPLPIGDTIPVFHCSFHEYLVWTVQAIFRIQRSAVDLCPDCRFIPTQ